MKKMIVAMMVVVCTTTGFFANGAAIEDTLTAALPLTCTITIKGTYNNTPVDITVTVEADNCAKAAGDMLKSIIAKK